MDILGKSPNDLGNFPICHMTDQDVSDKISVANYPTLNNLTASIIYGSHELLKRC